MHKFSNKKHRQKAQPVNAKYRPLKPKKMTLTKLRELLGYRGKSHD
jgi:hypothetical protein